MNRLPHQQAGTLLYAALTLAMIFAIGSVIVTFAVWQVDMITNRTTYNIQQRFK